MFWSIELPLTQSLSQSKLSLTTPVNVLRAVLADRKPSFASPLFQLVDVISFNEQGLGSAKSETQNPYNPPVKKMRFSNISAVIVWMLYTATILIVHPEILDYVSTSGELAFHTHYEEPRRQEMIMRVRDEEKLHEDFMSQFKSEIINTPLLAIIESEINSEKQATTLLGLMNLPRYLRISWARKRDRAICSGIPNLWGILAYMSQGLNQHVYDTFITYTVWPTDILATIFIESDKNNYAHWLDKHAKLLDDVLGMDRESGNMVREFIKSMEQSGVLLETIRRQHNEYIHYLHDLDARQEEMKQIVKHLWLSITISILSPLMAWIFNQICRTRDERILKNILKVLAPLRKYLGEWSLSLKWSLKWSLKRSDEKNIKAHLEDWKSSWMDMLKFMSKGVPAFDEGPKCCVCLDNPPQVVLVPCGHMNICEPCAREWKKMRPVGEGKECGGGCPTCRRKIKKIQVFVPL